MAVLANTTVTNNNVQGQVVADIISGKLPHLLRVSPLAVVDTTLQQEAGLEISVPVWNFIGDASVVPEGDEVAFVKLSSTATKYKVQKVAQSVLITDEMKLASVGNPIDQASQQLALSMANVIDADALSELKKASLKHDAGTALISYNGIVDAVDLLEEEVAGDKVLFINPKQVTQLRKSNDFVARDKYGADVMIDGEIGMIAGCRVVPSRRIVADAGKYACPIVKLGGDNVTDLAALTIFMKRDVLVETARHTRRFSDELTASQFYVAALTNMSKVVLATFKGA